MTTPARARPRPPPPEGSFVGKVDGTDAYLALVSDGSRLGGYLCDGKQVSVWLKDASPDGDSAELEDREGAALGD